MSTRSRLNPAARRESLLDAAVGLAAHGSLTDVSVRDIASAAGVSEGLLYHYFPTKDALLLAAVRRAAEAMTAALDVAATVGDDPLRTALTAYLDHVQADPVGWRAILAPHSGEIATIADGVAAHSQRLLLKALHIRRPSPTLRAALEGWAALEGSACLVWLENPISFSRERLEDLLLSTFDAAMRAAARSDPATSAALSHLAQASGPSTC